MDVDTDSFVCLQYFTAASSQHSDRDKLNIIKNLYNFLTYLLVVSAVSMLIVFVSFVQVLGCPGLRFLLAPEDK